MRGVWAAIIIKFDPPADAPARVTSAGEACRYSRDAVTRQSGLDDAAMLLEKPFRKAEFARKLREALAAGD